MFARIHSGYSSELLIRSRAVSLKFYLVVKTIQAQLLSVFLILNSHKQIFINKITQIHAGNKFGVTTK